jgi:hypothetical protein
MPMDAENERILTELVDARILSGEDEAVVRAAAETAAQAEVTQPNILLCNRRSWCIVVR